MFGKQENEDEVHWPLVDGIELDRGLEQSEEPERLLQTRYPCVR